MDATCEMASNPPSPSSTANDSNAPPHDTMSNASGSNYGGIDPEVEENLYILPYVSEEGLRNDATDHRKTIGTSRDDYYPLPSNFNIAASGTLLSLPSDNSCRLLALPSELIDAILAYLPPCDLAIVAETCRILHAHAASDVHWYQRVQANVPGEKVRTPYPCRTYRELYAAHDPRWFLPKYKIWFCDRDLMGKMIIVRYDQRRGCIEGYQLLAVSNRTTYQHWPADHSVIIHAFEPRVKLHLDKPVLQFHARRPADDVGSSSILSQRFLPEVPMSIDDRSDAMFSNFLMARPLDGATATSRMDGVFPYGNVWPPPAIPARHRVAGVSSGLDGDDLAPGDLPTRRAETSDQAFRIRQWMEMAGSPTPGLFLGPGPVGIVQAIQANMGMGTRGVPGVHIGEEVVTYSTLDPVVYTPTALKPWRGIWVGDYSGHGCEFLLINQPDDEEVSDEELGLIREAHESDAEWTRRRTDARVYRGRLEAIKLTGDPNVPRGEYTFVADDLGEAGFVGVAQEPPFQGTRVVKSKDKYIESQLMLVSHDRLAQYWVGFGHISFFERVNLEEFMSH
ncbi:F-box domain-containing protein [Colletotrichum orchidophilum]|uniref:F-box domain-containing protein n=1 Tax=Colletotrichum orchidophilum TaxID=1209926 RepID=A0A1G4BTI1_9PEZI|nr:F-box domain-containing protein [Colletotrichum orchidophilum]OHF04665.1 F-box domain-containing protein [Colletotrichum orchidophilum]